MNKYVNAINHLTGLIKKVDSTAIIRVSQINLYNYNFYIEIRGQKNDIIFGRDLIDDFEIAINKYPETDYYYTLENAIRFKIFISLGQEGFIPSFDISSELLSEKREWLKDYRGDVSFEKKICEIIYEGLKKLSYFLDGIIKTHNLELKEMRGDKEYIDDLMEYYEKNKGSFSSSGVGVDSLGFLKAAAVCEIIGKEKVKKQETMPRITRGIDKEIYFIVAELRKAPFIGIKLPECIYEYVKQGKTQTETRILEEERNISEKQESDKLDNLLDKLNPTLKNKRCGAWVTFNSDNPDRLSQSANSMVELLNQVIDSVCSDRKLSEYLKDKYETKEETEWIEAEVKWISKVKDNLQRIKHHPDYKLEKIAKRLLCNAENIILLILE